MNKEEFKNGLVNAIQVNEIKQSPLSKVNEMLFEELKRLENLDITDPNAQMEINRSNAMANTSKTILQATGIQLMIQKQLK